MRSTRPASSSVVLNSWNEISRTSETDPRNAPAAATSRPVAAAFTKAGWKTARRWSSGPHRRWVSYRHPNLRHRRFRPFATLASRRTRGRPGAPGLAGFPVPALGLKCPSPRSRFLPPSAQNRAACERSARARRARRRARPRAWTRRRRRRWRPRRRRGRLGRETPDEANPAALLTECAHACTWGAPRAAATPRARCACDERVGELRGDGGGVPARERAFHDPGRGPLCRRANGEIREPRAWWCFPQEKTSTRSKTEARSRPSASTAGSPCRPPERARSRGAEDSSRRVLMRAASLSPGRHARAQAPAR